MPKHDGPSPISKNLIASFSPKRDDDCELKAELQRRLDESPFRSHSDFAKDLFRRALGAAKTEGESALSEELQVTLRTIQQQLVDLRASERAFQSLLETIDQRTRTILPMFAEGMAELLVQLTEWDEQEAAKWAKEHLLRRRNGRERP